MSFPEQNKHEFPMVLMCHVLEVSESGFYAWRKRPTCQHQREDAQIKQEIQQVRTHWDTRQHVAKRKMLG